MTELVPFQTKRSKKIRDGITPQEAIAAELEKYLKKNYPTVEATETARELSTRIAPVTSPALMADKSVPWTQERLELPIVSIIKIAEQLQNKKRLSILPKPYQKMIRRVYTSKEILQSLAKDLASNKRAKRMLRIMQKRLGIYAERKPPFKETVLSI